LFGYTAKEVGAKLGTGLLPLPEGVQVIKTLLAFLRKTGDERHFENEWVDSSGKPRTITWTISILTKNEKSVEYVFAAGLDITSRKVAEKTLERERALLNGLLNSIPDLVFYKDKNGTYTGCNAAFELFSKIKGVDIIGKTDVDLYGLDLGLQFLKTDKLALQINQSINFENWFRGEDGLPVLIETRKNPYYDPEGNMLGIIGIGRDITKHRNSEDALRKAKHEIEQLISSLSSILIALSPEMFITKLNPSAQNILGINPSEAIGKRLEDAGIPWEWPIISKHLNRCRQNLSSEFLDPVPFKRRDGLSGFLGININPILDEAKNLSGIIILAGDITERKILEERYTQSQRLGSIGRLASGISMRSIHQFNI
jgi:PAS domain S-box-containing protein